MGATPAERIGDRYAVFGEIASGGMASVHFGRLVGPVGFSRTVAVKRLHANLREQPEFVRMFLDEARLATRIRHPNVVATIDVIETPSHICLVMEYVHGESLRRLARAAMAQGGRIPRRIVAAVVVGALHGLHAAHEAKSEQSDPLNIVHRDVSPHNIIVGTDGIARVIDFGIAKARGQLRDTDAGTIKGKFAYMAPEQLVGAAVTRAADIYAASVMLWELLTGRRLFGSKIDTSILERAKVKIDPPSSIVPSLTPVLDGIVLKGLAADPAQRFTTARAMARAIEDCIAPASPADIGEWVERMAHDRLEQREAQLKEMEGQDAETIAPSMNLPTRPVLHVRSDSASEDTNPPSESAVVPMMGRPSEVDTLERPPVASSMPPRIEPGMSDTPSIPVQRGQGVPSYHPDAPTLDARAPVIAPAAPRRFPWGRFWFATLLVMGGGAVTAGVVLPGYASKRVVEEASARGIRLTGGDTTVRWGRVMMTDVHAQPVGLDGVTLDKVGDLEVTTRGARSGAVVVRGFEATMAGPVGDVTGNVARWAAAQTAPLDLDARAGHLRWTEAFGEGTVLEAWDTTVHAGEGKLEANSPSVMITTPHGKLGPWVLRFERSGEETKLEVALDATRKTVFTLVRSGGHLTGMFETPRTLLSRLGIPSETLGIFGDVEIAGRASFQLSASTAAVPPSGPGEGQVVLSFYGLRSLGHEAGPLDASLNARFATTGTGPLEIQDGQAAAGANRARTTGTFSWGDGGGKLTLALAWTGKGGLPPSLTLDTRDLAAWGKH